MGALIRRTTLLAAVLTAFVVASIDAGARIALPVLVGRAVLAFGIVAAIGFGVGWILMRTVLRRRYEAWRLSQTPPRARADR